ncbi:MAG: MotA/TolQ/ExbB proton channel family protein [Bdellovibrionaceae bacterium]|jgi:biopolymer transport protein ExbB|nr:MotA/TolQ/ExbB proton channel family protein [Pseudobdellovibrionaceae bacterium]
MENLIKVITDGGIPAYVIVIMGICGLALTIERAKVLYIDYSIKTQDFMNQVKSLIMGDKIEEAITFCNANNKAPLAHVVKGVLERADRDDEGIDQGLDIALSEVIPNLGKRLGYLSMIANVSTLVGLLGTITGLIMSFEAVGAADPAQKQLVLSQGISMAMNTTALGLSVAIPVMIGYAFLHARQNFLLEEISEHSSKVVDLLTTRHYQPFSQQAAFPRALAEKELQRQSGAVPPPPAKVS